jgi:16S rRNA (guanine527-N7)-methyltransferase
MLKNKLVSLVDKTNLKISEQQLDLLVGYVNLLDKWNKAYNLTSIRNPSEMLVKHILDSLTVSEHLQILKGNNTFIDVGTGPGLPGIPLAIINPDFEFTLLDSLGKRVRFMTQVKHELKLQNILPVQSRVEDFKGDFAGILSRAFASVTDMVTWSHHLLAENGKFYALKGQVDQDELSELPEFVSIDQVIPLKVPELEGERHLITMIKN